MATSNDGEDNVAETATKQGRGAAAAKPAAEEKPAAPAAAAEGAAAAPASTDPAVVMAAMLETVRAQSAAMLEQAQATAAAMVEAARAEVADVAEQARIAQDTASGDAKVKAKALVDQGRREFESLTTGDGRIWLQHEREQDFEPVKFVAAAGPKSELRVLRVGRHEYSHAGRTETSPGVAYQFVRGEFEALSEDVAAYLRGRPSCGVHFWEADKAPGAAPDPSVMLEKVLDAVLELDDDALRVLGERERASHNRPAVLKAILHGRRQIRGRTGATQGDE